MRWMRAIDIVAWANSLEARSRLPELVRRLIWTTVPTVVGMDFPAGEEVQRHGWDGKLEAESGTQHVPVGISRWEMGTNADPADKASSDYRNRTRITPDEERAQQTFVFVTPRKWEAKDSWIEKRSNDGWGNILVYDANDLEQWLETTTPVDVWLAGICGRRPSNVKSFDEIWADLSAIRTPSLNPSTFLVSREGEIKKVDERLRGVAGSMSVGNCSRREGIDFLSAMFARWPSRECRALVVNTQEAWQLLAAEATKMIMVPGPSLTLASEEVARAVRYGHHVILPGGPQIEGDQPPIDLSRPVYWDLSKTLTESGISESRADQLAQACCGNTTVLKRLVAQHASDQLPGWAVPEVASRLAPFALLGGWRHEDPNPLNDPDMPYAITPCEDLLLVEELTGLSGTEVEAEVTKWSRSEDPFFVTFGKRVFVSSREDAWATISQYITARQLQTFETVAIVALGSDDPSLDLPSDKRWLANVMGKSLSISKELQRSLIQTLGLIASRAGIRPLSPGVNPKATVRRVVESVLPRSCSWKRWASLSSYLPLLAEADPEYLLSAIEDDLKSGRPQLTELFREEGDPLFSRTYHADVLWALETLAWNQDLFVRVVLVLGALAEIDPGGRSANRPKNSLYQFFVPGFSQPLMELGARVAALRKLLSAHPKSGWELLLEVSPGRLQGFVSPMANSLLKFSWG